MKILLTVFGVYNTLENVDDEVFKEIIDKIKQVKESYRKIRNTYKFMLGNLKDKTQNKESN